MTGCTVCGAATRKSVCRSCWRDSVRQRSLATADERFWAQVDRTGGPDACWQWTGNRIAGGYGRFGVAGEQVYAHRRAWEITAGAPFPAGMHACHTCDNPTCCNPGHIYAGTQGDNVRDMYARGRWSVGETCRRGHERSVWMRGTPGRVGRYCLLCREGWRAVRNERRRAKRAALRVAKA